MILNDYPRDKTGKTGKTYCEAHASPLAAQEWRSGAADMPGKRVGDVSDTICQNCQNLRFNGSFPAQKSVLAPASSSNSNLTFPFQVGRILEEVGIIWCGKA